MSAIAGILHLDGRQCEGSILNRMTEALIHRGPDRQDGWLSGPAGLGHCMLWTTPESLHEILPYTSDDGMLTITADARIDNRNDLITALGLTQQTEIIPDSFLILSAYRQWGESCVDHLLGDFAFAIWDNQKQHLFCARDHMGVRPFYYYCSGQIFIFASEMKALFSVPGIPRELNEKGIACRLAGIDPDPSITSYLHILRLRAAHSMTVSIAGTRICPYWSLDPDREIHFKTDEEYKSAFRNIFSEAVRCRLRSAFPVGSELSGGLDSSSVVCVARHLLRQEKSGTTPRQLHTFSAVFDEVPECDERPFMNYVLAGGDLTPHYIFPERISPLSDIENRISQCEEPALYPTSHTYTAIFQTARDNGVRVMLNGEYGDGVVSYGEGVLLDFVIRGKWLRAIQEIMGIAENYHVKKRSIIWYNLIRPFIPRMIRQRSDRFPVPWIQRDFAERTGIAGYYADLQKAEWSLKSARGYHFSDLSSHPFSHGLEVMNKKASVCSIEPRFPFLDRRVVEFCLALPPEQRLRNGYGRLIEREGLGEFLPPEIRTRTSKAVADPYIRYSLAKFEEKYLERILMDHQDIIRSYVVPDYIQGEYRKLMTGSVINLFAFWNTLLLIFWLKGEKMAKEKQE